MDRHKVKNTSKPRPIKNIPANNPTTNSNIPYLFPNFTLKNVRKEVKTSEKLCQLSARIADEPVRVANINFRIVRIIFNIKAKIATLYSKIHLKLSLSNLI